MHQPARREGWLNYSVRCEHMISVPAPDTGIALLCTSYTSNAFPGTQPRLVFVLSHLRAVRYTW